MTERQFLDRQSRRIRERIRSGSVTLHEEIERAIGPAIRRHPRLSLAAGASAGLLLGRVLRFPSRLPGPHAVRGVVAGSFRFIKETGVFALRSMIVGSLLSSSGRTGTAPGGATGDGHGSPD